MIAQLIRDKKTVLFVSEKAAALEVVHKRLDDIGLAPFVLALHSHKTTRKAVAQELAESLETRPEAASARTLAATRAQAKQGRQQLSNYAAAINEKRRPSQRNFHDTAGEISALSAHRVAVVPDMDTTALTPEAFQNIVATAERLGSAWAPVERGDDFLWRGLAQRRVSSSDETDYRNRVVSLSDALAQLRQAVASAHDDLRITNEATPAQAEWTQQLLALVEHRQPATPQWLITGDGAAVNKKAERLADEIDHLHTAEQQLDVSAPAWRTLDPDAAQRVEQHQATAAALHPQPPQSMLTERSPHQIAQLAEALSVAAGDIDAIEAPAAMLRTAFGVEQDTPTQTLHRLVDLGQLADADPVPEPEWFTATDRAAATDALESLSEATGACSTRRGRLTEDFAPDVLDLDLEGLHDRFTHTHRGVRRLAGAYRKDKATLATAALSGKTTKETIACLDSLVTWQRADRCLQAAEQDHAACLGSYYLDRERSDLDAARIALQTAEEAVQIAGGTVSAATLAATIGRPGGRRIAETADVLGGLLAGLHDSDLREQIGPATMIALDGLSLQAAARWCRHLAAAATVAAADTAPAAEASTTAPATATVALELLSARAAQHRLAAAVADRARPLAVMTGEQVASNLDSGTLRACASWVAQVQDHLGAGIEPETATRLTLSDLTESHVAEPLRHARQAANELLEVFEPDHAETLRRQLDSSYDTAAQLLDALHDTAADMHVWSDYTECSDALAAAGLDSVLSECERLRKPGQDIADIVRLAVLRRWADQTIDADPRLRRGRSADRDKIRADFQRHDQQLVEAAAAEVINACAARRPAFSAGGAGIIKQQAQLKKTTQTRSRAAGTRFRRSAAHQTLLHDEPTVSLAVPATGHDLRRGHLRRGFPSQRGRRRRLHLSGPPAHRRRRPETAPADQLL